MSIHQLALKKNNQIIIVMDIPESLGGFQALFAKSVPHILENIFLSLDQDTLVSCRKVCRAWYRLLSMEPYSERMLKALKAARLKRLFELELKLFEYGDVHE